RFFVKHLGREMTLALAEQEPAQRHALAGRTQADRLQQLVDVMPRTAGQGRRAGLAGNVLIALCGDVFTHVLCLQRVRCPAAWISLNSYYRNRMMQMQAPRN